MNFRAKNYKSDEEFMARKFYERGRLKIDIKFKDLNQVIQDFSTTHSFVVQFNELVFEETFFFSPFKIRPKIWLKGVNLKYIGISLKIDALARIVLHWIVIETTYAMPTKESLN